MITLKKEKMTLSQQNGLGDLGTQAVRDAIQTVAPNLEKDFVQSRIIGKPGDFKNRIKKAVEEILRDMGVSDKYANEEVKSTYGYLSGYRAPKSVAEQIAILQTHNWDKEVDWNLNEQQQKMASQKPPQGEGWGVIVFDQSVITNHEDDAQMDYGKPMQHIQELIRKSRGRFYDYREGKWRRQHYRRSTELTESMKALWIAQGSPTGIMLIPFQFGINHAGRSVRRAREVMMNEFGLGAYEVLTLILTHPERMSDSDDLWIDCAGDEYSNNGDGLFVCASRVWFYDDGVRMGASDVSDAREFFGSASGFPAIESLSSNS